MNERTVKLNLEASLPMNESFCDGCPALGERVCNQLNVTLDCSSDGKGNGILHAIRNERCPFNATKCYVCGTELIPSKLQGNGTDKYFLDHKCGENTDVSIIAIGKSYDECIKNYERYVISIKRAFTQR